MTIIDLYVALRDDPRLQKNWERNQPRIDRTLESPLIARTSREVATAALLAIKLRFVPEAAAFLAVQPDAGLVTFARTQGSGGTRLANVLEGKRDADDTAKAAAFHTLAFYRNRAQANGLLRLGWTDAALVTVGKATVDDLINPALRPSSAERKAKGVAALAAMLPTGQRDADDDRLRAELRDVPGLGPERADAAGVFGFHRPWPIVDQYLWSLLARHGIITAADAEVKSYDARRRAFDPHWKQLCSVFPEDLNQLAATLYLWADEAERFGHSYG